MNALLADTVSDDTLQTGAVRPDAVYAHRGSARAHSVRPVDEVVGVVRLDK